MDGGLTSILPESGCHINLPNLSCIRELMVVADVTSTGPEGDWYGLTIHGNRGGAFRFNLAGNDQTLARILPNLGRIFPIPRLHTFVINVPEEIFPADRLSDFLLRHPSIQRLHIRRCPQSYIPVLAASPFLSPQLHSFLFVDSTFSEASLIELGEARIAPKEDGEPATALRHFGFCKCPNITPKLVTKFVKRIDAWRYTSYPIEESEELENAELGPRFSNDFYPNDSDEDGDGDGDGNGSSELEI